MGIDPQTWMTAGAVLVGALVGGAASALGSAWTARREHRREVRMRLYDELIPDLIDRLESVSGGGLPGITAEIGDAVLPVLRAADVAGRKDSEHVEPVRHADTRLDYHEQTADYTRDPYGNMVPTPESVETAQALLTEMADALVAYQQWLRRKI